MPLAELFWCDAGIFFKDPEEIFYIVVTDGSGDLVHFPVGMGQKLLGPQNADVVQIIHEFLTGAGFEQGA